MYDQRNLPDYRPGYGLTDSGSTCPYPSGATGLWLSSGVYKFRNANGSDSEIPSAQAAYAPVRLVMTSVPNTGTYNSTTLAITAGSNAALTVDSVTAANGDRVLVATGNTYDGIYTVTSKGSAGTKWVITRAADMNASGAFVNGGVVAASAGTVYANTLWELSFTTPFTMDTTQPTFTQTATAVTGAAVKTALATVGAANGVTGNALSAGSMRLLAFAGHNGAGACTATGTKVGDTVIGVIDLAAGSVSAAASFESTITVNDQIQQTSASNLSAVKYALLVVAKS